MKKALVVYFSQTGQAKNIVDNVLKPLSSEIEITYEELRPVDPFPFPWKGMSFFQAFPESVEGIPCELEPFKFDSNENFDLVILAFQVWYLSPSIPISSFLQTPEAEKVIRGKHVITIQGNRNMWVMSQERIKNKIQNLGGNLVGNIVLHDKNPNLVSVITIVHWMMKGERFGSGLYKKIFPPAGITEADIKNGSEFGETILNHFQNDNLNKLQDKLIELGAVEIKPVLASIEKRGFMMFKIWSKFILKKGSYNSKEREKRLKLFKYYLFTVIYLVSPFASIVFYILHKLQKQKTNRMIEYYSHNKLQ